jgi:16S rRNA (guanine527-N7)-methyltransferase
MFHVELLKFNGRLNLISNQTMDDSDILHVWDAVLFFKGISNEVAQNLVADFGSGNGVPGVIGAILFSEVKWKLFEKDERKCAFLRHLQHALHIQNMEVVNVNVVNHQFIEPVVVISRGFASIKRHIEIFNGNASLKQNLVCGLCMKGPGVNEEVEVVLKNQSSTWNVQIIKDYILELDSLKLRRLTAKISKPIP